MLENDAHNKLDKNSISDCLYCATNNYKLLYDTVQDYLGHVGGTWQYWQCQNCHSVTLYPTIKSEDIPSLYPDTYGFIPERKDQGSFKKILANLEYVFFFKPQYQNQVKKIIKKIGSPSQKTSRTLLDIGCGNGLRSLTFKKYNVQTMGSDIQHSVIEYLKNTLNIHAVCCDASAVAKYFPEKSFDIITAFMTLEHVPNVQHVLESCRTLLKSDGFFVCSVPLIDSMQGKILRRHWVSVKEAPRHLSIPSHKGIITALQKAGFTDIETVGDSAMASAGMIGLSLFPQSATGVMYAHKKKILLTSLFYRLLGALATILFIPLCTIENLMSKKPSSAIIVARNSLKDINNSMV